jgi:hypothetical protein
MKKKMIFGLAMASIALLPSCSNDETVDLPSGKPIEFSGSFVDKSTRSNDPSYTTSNLNSFQVYGWVSSKDGSALLFDNDTVTHYVRPTSTYWAYTGATQYWVEGGEYTFSAIVGANGNLTINGEDNVRVATPKIEGFTSDGQTDLIYSEYSATGLASGNPAVSFTFQHQLAKVRFSFRNDTNNANSNIEAKVTNIKMTDPIATGDVELSNEQYGAKWSNQAKAETPTALDFGSAGDETTGYIARTPVLSACSQEQLVIPAGDDQTYTVTFTASIYQKDVLIKTVECTSTIKDIAFKPGYAYNFTAELLGDALGGSVGGLEAIKFDNITVDEWTDDNNDSWTKFTPSGVYNSEDHPNSSVFPTIP